MNIVQYKILVQVELLISVDTEKDNIVDVINDLNYDFDVPDENQNSEVVQMEFLDWEILDTRDDSILF
jgi:hypothetical protein